MPSVLPYASEKTPRGSGLTSTDIFLNTVYCSSWVLLAGGFVWVLYLLQSFSLLTVILVFATIQFFSIVAAIFQLSRAIKSRSRYAREFFVIALLFSPVQAGLLFFIAMLAKT